MESCIFCKIANGQIPSITLYEDASFRVILDISPASKGHTLILPKEHFANLYELREDLAEKVLPLAQKIIKELTPILKCSGYNILQNNGETAGQTVNHFHLHMIPRYTEDKVCISWDPENISSTEIDKIVNALQNIHI